MLPQPVLMARQGCHTVNVIDYAQQIQSSTPPPLPLPLPPHPTPFPEHLELSSILAKISRNYNKLKRERGNICAALVASLVWEHICICNTCHTDTCLPAALTAKCCILILCKFPLALSLPLSLSLCVACQHFY